MFAAPQGDSGNRSGNDQAPAPDREGVLGGREDIKCS
jgi:hypothetical protein